MRPAVLRSGESSRHPTLSANPCTRTLPLPIHTKKYTNTLAMSATTTATECSTRARANTLQRARDREREGGIEISPPRPPPSCASSSQSASPTRPPALVKIQSYCSDAPPKRCQSRHDSITPLIQLSIQTNQQQQGIIDLSHPIPRAAS